MAKKTQKLKKQLYSRIKIVIKLKNSNCNKKSKTQIVIKLKTKLWLNSKTQIMKKKKTRNLTKPKNSNYNNSISDTTWKMIVVRKKMKCTLGSLLPSCNVYMGDKGKENSGVLQYVMCIFFLDVSMGIFFCKRKGAAQCSAV